MAEKVIIDIELKGLGDAKKGLDDLNKKQVEQKEKISETSGQIKAYEKDLAALRKEQQSTGQTTAEQAKQEQELKAKIEQTKISLQTQKDELTKINSERRVAVKDLNNYKTAQDANLGSNERMKAQLAILTKEYNSLSQEERQNTAAGKEMGKNILDLTNKLKQNESAVGDNRRNVGNYVGALNNLKTSILNVAGAFGVFFGAAQIGRAIKDSVKIVKDFETSLTNLANVLGTTREGIPELIKQAQELGATSAFSASQVVELQESYARLGFSQQQIIDLTPGTINGAIALRASADETANLVGAVVNSFDELAATDATMIIDQMTAATQNSALNFEKLNSALPNVAGAANAAGVSFNQTVALLGKLSDAGIDASKSGTALKNIFITAAKEGKTYDQILEDIATSGDKLSGAVDKVGKISAVSATVLANSIEKTGELNEKILASAGTSEKVAEESLKTVEGQLLLLSSAWEGFILSIDNGNGVISTLIKGVLIFLQRTLSLMTNNGKEILTGITLIAGAIAMYNAQLILATANTIKNAVVTKAKAAADFLLTGAMGAASLAAGAYSTIMGVLTGSISLAQLAAIAFKVTLDVLSGGITLVITAIGAAVAALVVLINRTDKLTAAQQALIDVQNDAEKSFVKERLEIDRLTKTIESETTSREKKLEAIERLNEMMPEGLALITEEDIATGKLTEKIELLSEAKLKQYKLDALRNKQAEVAEELIDAENSSIEDNIKWYDYAVAGIKSYATYSNKMGEVTEKAEKRRQESIDALKEEQQALLESEEATIAEMEAVLNNTEAKEDATNATKQLTEEELKALDKKKKKQEEDEAKRLVAIDKIIRTEQEELEFKKNKLLEELKIEEDRTNLTAAEKAAQKSIIDQYNKDVEKLEQDRLKKIADARYNSIEKDLKAHQESLEKFELENEIALLKELENFTGTQEEKQAIIDEYNKKGIQAQKDAIAAQMFEIDSQINQLFASSEGMNVADQILSKEQVAELKKRLLELEAAGLKLDAELKTIGVDPETGQPSLAKTLNLSEEQTEQIKAGYAAATQGINDILNIAGQALELRTQERIKAIDEQVQSGALSEEAAEKEKEKIRKEAFEKQKKLDIASATMSYLTGLVQTIAGNAKLGFPLAIIMSSIQSAILTAAYATNVAKIKKQKFQDGGLIQGESHAKGGVPFTVAGRGGFEAEGGEYIVKKSTVDNYGVDFMNALNNMKVPKMFAEGGYVAPTPAGTISDQVSRGVSELVSVTENRQLQVINVEQDFTKLQTKVSNVEQARTY
jgi:hypothetical protein